MQITAVVLHGVEKREFYSLSWEKFRENNSQRELVLIQLISRNFFKEIMKVKSCNIYTVSKKKTEQSKRAVCIYTVYAQTLSRDTVSSTLLFSFLLS